MSAMLSRRACAMSGRTRSTGSFGSACHRKRGSCPINLGCAHRGGFRDNGFTLAGMMLARDEGRQRISRVPRGGPEFIQRQVVRIWAGRRPRRAAEPKETAVSCAARLANRPWAGVRLSPLRDARPRDRTSGDSGRGDAVTTAVAPMQPGQAMAARPRCGSRIPRPESARRAFPGPP